MALLAESAIVLNDAWTGTHNGCSTVLGYYSGLVFLTNEHAHMSQRSV